MISFLYYIVVIISLKISVLYCIVGFIISLKISFFIVLLVLLLV